MPSLDTVMRVNLVKNNGAKTIGQIHKETSDWLMEETWFNDPQSKVCYIYDFAHDDQPMLKDHMTYKYTTKTKIDAKFIITQYGSISKDQVAYHIMFKPSQKMEFSPTDELYYFETEYRKKYDIQFPYSLYIDIPNERGIYEKWLIINMEQGNQFIKYNVLPCNYLFEWIEQNGQERIKRRMWGVDRQQLSYTSGIWIDRYFHSLDNVEKSYLPLNAITENINYVGENMKNQRMIISAKVNHPTVWQVTKVENTHPIGVLQMTFSQTEFDPHRDYIEPDETGKIIGMWADYWDTTNEPNIEPIDPSIPVMKPTIIGKIKASTPSIKVGGSYKTLTVQLFDSSDNDITDQFSDADFIWTCSVINKDKTAVSFDGATWRDGTSFNQKKIKFPNDRSYLDKVLEIKCTIIHKDIGLEVTEQFDLII